MPPKKRVEAEKLGLTAEVLRNMNIRGSLSRTRTWERAIAAYNRRETVDAPATGSEIVLAPESAVVPATPQQGAIVPQNEGRDITIIHYALNCL